MVRSWQDFRPNGLNNIIVRSPYGSPIRQDTAIEKGSLSVDKMTSGKNGYIRIDAEQNHIVFGDGGRDIILIGRQNGGF